MSTVPPQAAAAVLKPSDPLPPEAVSVKGPDFEKPLSLDEFLESYTRIGFQATSLGKAVDVVNSMVRIHSDDIPSS
jgi:deoxyhypusine synthase